MRAIRTVASAMFGIGEPRRRALDCAGAMLELSTALQRVRPSLAAAFGNRRRDVILHGSRARGDHRPDSDVNILVLLDGPIALERDVPATVAALYPLRLELDVPIHASPADARAFAAQEYELHRRVRREGLGL